MGSCGSKCCFTSPTPSISEPGSPPDDKAVIFSVDADHPLPLTAPPPSNDPFSDSPSRPSKFQVHPSPPVPSSSISTSTSTSTTTSNNTTASYSSFSYSTDNSFDSDLTRPPLRKKSFSNEFLLSCVENSNIVILDPSRSATKQKPVQNPISIISEIPVKASMQVQPLTTSSLRQRTPMTMRNSQSSNTNVKRARSVSPASRSGHKVIRPDPGLWSPESSNIARPRPGDLPPPQWRPVTSQRGSINDSWGPVPRPVAVSANKRDLMEIEAKEGEMQHGDGARTPPLVEDLNNPLIAMDCFIFL